MTLFSGRRRQHASALVLTLTSALIGSSFALAPSASGNPAGTGLVISEVYGGGGNAGATYTHDFVELHNPTDAAIGLGGLSVQYRSATGTAEPTGVAPLRDVELPAGGHYLVSLAGSTANGAPLPVTADQSVTGVNLSASTGTVLLVDGTLAYNPGVEDQAGDPGLVDLVGFGGSNTYENAATATALRAPAPSNSSSVTRTAGRDSDDNSADFVIATGGALSPIACGDACQAPPPPPPPPATELAIVEIQGEGATSPVSGDTVITRGVVTATYPTGGLKGFYIQTPGTGGALKTSHKASRGLFVFGDSAVTAMNQGLVKGDFARVTGVVSEFNGLTELTPQTPGDIVELRTPFKPVAPATVAWPETDVEREKLEGMLLAPQGSFTVSDNFNLNRFAEIGLARGTEPLRQPTDVAPFGSAAAAAQAAENAARAVTLDDGASLDYTSNANEDTALPWLTDDPTIRVGESARFVRPVVLGYGFGRWRFQPTAQLTAGDANRVAPVTFDVTTRTSAPADVGGDLQVGGFNVLNYFTDLGEDLTGCRYFTERDESNPVTVSGGCDARGAAAAEDFERQEAKIVRAIIALGAEVVSLSEIENSAKFGHPRDESLATLVDALNADLDGPEWAFVPSPADGPAAAEEDFIRNAFIYQPAAVSLVGESEIRPSIGTSDPFVNARDPLAQVFQPVGAVDGDRFMLVVNHFKSKGSPPRDTSDVNRDYGQGNWNVRRTEQAAALATWVDQLQVENGVERVYLDGDFNSYTYEDPMLALYGKGYTNLDVRFGGGHTYQFDGLVGSLDHGLANEAALASTTGATVWNINSVEPIALEYSRYNYNATLFYDGTTPYRASDHDPILFGIDTTPTEGRDATVPPM